MKILCYGDVHFSTFSSIVRSRGEKYSTRLENIIKSVNWAENLANELECGLIVGMGDFFDKSTLTSEELTALKEIKWASLPHAWLVGNHEMGSKEFSSAHNMLLNNSFKVIDSPVEGDIGECRVCYLPYILESDRKPLNTYFTKTDRPTIVFSHNDIKGIQMGQFQSTVGFDMEEITNFASKFINGHIHNCGKDLTNTLFNVGNLTGQNFSEDAFKYSHCAVIVDTNTLGVEYIPNPYALNFYQLDMTDEIGDIPMIPNSVVTIKVNEEDVELVKSKINASNNIISNRIIVNRKHNDIEATEQIETKDHIQQFIDYVYSNIGTSDIIKRELEEVCK